MSLMSAVRRLGLVVTTLVAAGGANAALFDRGNGMIYDSVLNVTWLQDWNYAQTSGHDADGLMTWQNARSWANNLVFGGYDDWRLPKMVDTGAPGCDFSSAGGTDCGYNVQTITLSGKVRSEYAHLFYVSLGNKGFCFPGDAACSTEQPGWGLVNVGPFVNMQPQGMLPDNASGSFSSPYWTGRSLQTDLNQAWFFDPFDGGQSASLKSEQFFATAVRDGDVMVTPVPEPQTYLLMMLGLAGVGALVKRESRKRSTETRDR